MQVPLCSLPKAVGLSMCQCTELVKASSPSTHSGVGDVDAVREPSSDHQCQNMHWDEVDQEHVTTPGGHLQQWGGDTGCDMRVCSNAHIHAHTL